MKKLDKKQLALISAGLIGLALLVWLFLGAIKLKAVAGGQSEAEAYSGLKALLGIEYQGASATGFNIVALVAVAKLVITEARTLY